MLKRQLKLMTVASFFFFNLKIYVQINEVFIVIFSGHHMSLVSGSADLFVEDTLGLIH